MRFETSAATPALNCKPAAGVRATGVGEICLREPGAGSSGSCPLSETA